ncbi:hypothetical protein KCU93_g9819, partial [Aureobasidium melanogenum]
MTRPHDPTRRSDSLASHAKKRKALVENNEPTRRTRGYQLPAPSPVPGSIGSLVSGTYASSVPSGWEPVNNCNAIPVSSPSLGPKSREAYHSLVVKILRDYPNGLTSKDIVEKITQSSGSNVVRNQLKSGISNALSSKKNIFTKGSQDSNGKHIWTLKDHDSGSSLRPRAELSKENSVNIENDSSVIVATPREQGSETQHPDLTDNLINQPMEQVAGDGSSARQDEGATTSDKSPITAVEMLNSVIVGQAPLASVPNDSAAAPENEKNQPLSLQELQQSCFSTSNLSVKPRASSSQTSVRGSPRVVGQIAPLPRPEVGVQSPVQVQRPFVEGGSAANSPRGIQDMQDLASKKTLDPRLVALVSKHTEEFFGHFQQQFEKLQEFRNHLSPVSQNNNDAHPDTKALLETYWKHANPEIAPAQSAVTDQNLYPAIEALKLARSTKKEIESAISELEAMKDETISLFDNLKRYIDSLESSRSSLQEYRLQAVASKESWQGSIGAFINQDEDA